MTDEECISSELTRLYFVIDRDGYDEAYIWAKRVAKTYHHLMDTKEWRWTRRAFIGSIIVLGQFIGAYDGSIES